MKADEVKTRADFVVHLREFVGRLKAGEPSIENTTLDAYLEAMAAWTEDMEGYFASRHEPIPAEPSWRLLAQMIEAAAVYE